MFVDTNVGTIDRILRLIVGVALVAFAIFGPDDVAWQGVGYLGFVPITTALLKTCPLYSLFGWSTCPRESAS
ncbi:MAG: DUF2892 domain-containing protein [Cohaesibacteraceae bacterium]